MFPSLIIASLLLVQDPTPAPKPEKVVTVTAKRFESDVAETPTGVTVIPRTEIEASPAKTLVDLLQGRAGLAVTRNSSTPQDAVVDARGFNNGGGNGSRLLVLVDGRRVNTVGGSSIDWAAIPLENVESIEIVRGPAAASYGDTAVAGVIAVTTRRPTKDPSGSAGASGGSFGTWRGWASYRLSEGPVGLSLFAGREDSEGFRKNSAFRGDDATALLTLDLAPARAWVKLSMHEDFRERPGTLTEAEVDALGRDGSTTVGDFADIRNGYVDLGADIALAGGTLTPTLSLGRDASDAETSFASGKTSSDTESRVLYAAVKYLARILPGGLDTTLVVGADLSLEAADSDTFNDFPPFFVQAQASAYDRRLSGVYARAESRISSSLLASAGVRLDRARIDFRREDLDLAFGGSTLLEDDREFSHTAPQAALSWFFTPDTSVYVSAGRTLRYPNRDELVGFLTSALDLDPERAMVYELGWRSREGELWSASAVLFLMDVHNEIFFVPPPVGEDVFATFNFGQNGNVEQVRHRGIELEAQGRPSSEWRVSGSVTWQRTTVESGPFDGKRMPVSPDLSASVTTQWEPVEGFMAALFGRYAGERFLLNDLSNDVDALEAVFVLDARVAYRWKKARAFFEAMNLLDREWFDNGGIGAGPTGIWGDRQAYNPAPGLGLWLGMNVEF